MRNEYPHTYLLRGITAFFMIYEYCTSKKKDVFLHRENKVVKNLVDRRKIFTHKINRECAVMVRTRFFRIT